MMSADADSRDLRSGSREEAAVFEVCWRLYDAGERDLLDGGVSVAAVDEALPHVRRGVVRGILYRLAEQGLLVRLQGAAPETLRARSSFAPAALIDGGESP